MSIAGIAGSSLSQLFNIQRNYQQLRGEFHQLGQGTQAGNLAHAQTDFVTLSQSVATQLGSNSPVAKTLNLIGQALQSGNLAAAQQGFNSLPAGLVNHSASAHRNQIAYPQGSFSQALDQLGQALQSGSLPAAQQAFATMQQLWQQVPPAAVSSASAHGG